MIQKFIVLLTFISLVSCVSDENSDSKTKESTEQSDLTDSVTTDIVSENDLTEPSGTVILPNTRNTGIFNELSPYYLRGVELTECDSGGGELNYDLDQKINEIVWTDSSLAISFSFIATCGSDFLCDVEMVDFNTINLIYHQYNSYASCYCCYGLEFLFGIHEYYDPEFYGQLDDLPEILYLMFNGESRVRLE